VRNAVFRRFSRRLQLAARPAATRCMTWHTDRTRIVASGIFGCSRRAIGPFTWLTFDGSYGTDRLNQRSTNFYDRGLLNTGNTDVETPGVGSLTLSTSNDQSSNSQDWRTAHFTLGSLRSTTRGAYQYEEDRFSSFGSGFNKLLVASVPDLQSGDPTQLSTGNTTSQIQNVRTMNRLDHGEPELCGQLLVQVSWPS